jgi:cytochrome c biogenesis protein ResB
MTTPVEQGARERGAPRPPGLGRRVYAALVSPKLAIALLVFVLACCLVGVTVFRGQEAGRRIFATLWFNSLLVVLAISSASAFFNRFWKRKRTMVSVGMIVFHLSFLGVLGGVVLNGLFSFQGTLRLTEGETLPVGQAASYDEYQQGRFFDPAWLRGEVHLVEMHTNFKVGGENKRAAYELEFSDGPKVERGFIYITEYMVVDGVRYFSLKEGYSVLAVLTDGAGRELYGAHVPLQSIRQADGSFLYASGSASAPGDFAFPPPPAPPRVQLEVNFFPGLQGRTGKVRFQARPLGKDGTPGAERVAMVPVGESVQVGELRLAPKEIRYWVGLSVRYDPGLNLILVSLCLGLLGMALTFIGRVRQGGPARRAGGDG